MAMEKIPLPATSIHAMRLDKWLWAARFFKTRSLATQAIDHGRVKLNGERVKPAHDLHAGDRLDIHLGDFNWTLVVRALSMQRGSAPVAQALYEEDPASQARRQLQVDERRLANNPSATIKGRPSKRARRLIHRFTGE